MNELEQLISQHNSIATWTDALTKRLVDKEGTPEYNDMHEMLVHCHAILIAYQDRIIEVESKAEPEPEPFVELTIIKGGRE